MKFKIDLHVHTRYSGDTDADPEEVIERAIELGLDGIAVTEHSSFEASEPLERLKDHYQGAILIVRGVEFSTAEGHCLIFGVDTDRLLGKYAPVREVIELVNAAGGAVVPSHPFRGVNNLGDGVLELPGICALEGFNGANMHAMNLLAIEAAGKRGLPFTGGSDAHTPRDVGSCFTGFDDAVTSDNFVRLLKAGGYRGVDTRKISRMPMPGRR